MNASPASAATALVADIGGTNCRLALVAADSGDILRRHDASTDSAPTPQDAIAAFLRAAGASPKRAAIALAGPVGDGVVKLTNSDWVFDRAAICAALGLDRLLLINDLAAQARAVLDLDAASFQALGPNRAPPWPDVVAVVGPGTGLGVAVLEPADAVRVRATEGGHVGFAPHDAFERALLEAYSAEFGLVSNEHVVSGPGLARLYRFLAARAGSAPAAIEGPEIVRRALSGEDAICRQTVTRYAALLGSICGDVMLAQGAEALVLVGALANAMAPILDEGGFRARLDDRGPRAGFLAEAPCLIAAGADLGLKGAAALLRDQR